MIPRLNRFHGLGSLRFAYTRGRTVGGELVSVKAARNLRLSNYRVAVVVSRKVNHSAVVRNRIRRRLYETIRRLDSQIVGAFDIVIKVNTDSLANAPAAKIEAELKSQLIRLGVLAEGS